MTSPSLANVATTSMEKILDMLQMNVCPLYSLLDAAQYPGFSQNKIPHSKHNKLISLLGEAAQENAIYAGPLLLTHPQQAECRSLKWLVAELNQLPFASLITSSQPLTSLTAHLSWLTDVEHEDETEWVMRYYDPRILPHWLSVLTPEQKIIALRGIHRWIYVDVRGQWQIIEGEDQEIPIIPERPMRLSEMQHEQLMQECLPYLLMDMLNDDDSSQLESIPKYERYDFFAVQIAKGQQHQLDSMMDLKTYCMLALMFGANFDIHREVKLALAPHLQQSVFSQRVLAWDAVQWNAVSKGDQCK